jgi:hypothetical protein
MKKKLLLLFPTILLFLASAYTQVTVTGYAFLEGQSNHANIKVRFIPESPAAVLDSTYTDALGYYQHIINEGEYTIQYEKNGYQSFPRWENTVIIENFNAGTGTLLDLGTEISSNTVSGTWNGTYTIKNDIEIQQGDTLVVETGSMIRFQGNYKLTVNGYIEVNGTEGNEVIFMSMPANQVYAGGQWAGIQINTAADHNSHLSYAEVEYGTNGIRVVDAVFNADNLHSHHNSNYGIYSSGGSSRVKIINSELNNNTNDGIYMDHGKITLNSVNCHHNSRYGAYYYYSYGTVTNTQHNNNSNDGAFINQSTGGLTIDNCEFNNNNSYGLRLYECDYVDVTYTEIKNNTSYGLFVDDYNNYLDFEDNTIMSNGSTGIRIDYSNSGMYFKRNLIAYNKSGHGVYYDNDYSHATWENNIFAYNSGDGINMGDNNCTINAYYNTFYGNTGDGIQASYSSAFRIKNNIFVNNNYGIYAQSAIAELEHNSFYENMTGQIYGLDHAPENTWDFVSQNANGDTADVYLNIYVEPSFSLTDSVDFTLQKTSKNINAGTVSNLDPDGTISDIGAFYYDQGNPHQVEAVLYKDQTVVLSWDVPLHDSLVSYNVYYKPSSASTFTFWANVTDTTESVTGLTNGVLYDFTVTGVYPAYESVYAPSVSEMPGDPAIVFNPDAINVTIPTETDTLVETLLISNPGTKDLSVDFFDYTQYGNGSVAMDGNGDYISVPDNSTLEGMDELTIELWYNKQASNSHDIVDKHHYSYSFYFNGNNLGFAKTNGTSYAYWYPTANVSNGWHHLAVTWKNNLAIIYIDGEVAAQWTNAPSTPIMNRGEDLRIGSGRWFGSSANGNMAEVRIWNVARTKEQINNSKNWSLRGDEEGLAGYWPLTANALDYSQNSNNGTLVGDTYFQEGETFDRYLLVDAPTYNIKPGDTAEVVLRFPNIFSGTQVFTTPIATNIYASSVIDYEFTVTYDSGVVSTPVHFAPVTATGLPYTIVITNAGIDGETIGIGDEIAIFDGELCVGAGVFDGSFNFVVTAWESDPGNGLAGFVPGNPISFKIFDNSADLEATTQATFGIGDGTFGYGQFSTVELSSTIYTTQPVSVTGGQFNLISFNLLPRYNAVETVFAGQTAIDIVYNDKGGAYIPEYNINTIGDIEFRDGYHLFTTADTTIYFQGTPVKPSEWNMTLEAGRWNSIAYISQDSNLITSAFPASIHDSIEIVQTSSGKVWIPSLGVNTIGYMKPGVGYQVATNANVNFSFSYDLFKSAGINARELNTNTEYFTYTETGLLYAVVIDVTALTVLEPGDEIAVFDGSICVGAVVYEGGDAVTVPTWEGYSKNGVGLIGFKAGHQIDVKVSKAGSRVLISLTLEEKDTFKSGYYSVLKAGNTSLNAGAFDFATVTVFPNPFSETVTISIPDAELVTGITIINITGEVIAELPVAETTEWNAIDSADGVYFVNIKTEDSVFSTRIVLLK